MIQRFSNITHQVLRQLKSMNYPTEHYDLMFVHSLHDKLDQSTSYDWGKERTSERPTIMEMLAFLDKRAKHLSSAQHLDSKPSHEQRKRQSPNNDSRNDNKKAKPHPAKEHKSSHSSESRNCKVCNKESHPVHRCQKFLKMELSARRKAAKDHNLCYNCLSASHSSRDCRSSMCKRCDKKHNSLLCTENPLNKSTNTLQVKNNNKKVDKSDSSSKNL